jgi:hypothetical protein
MSALHHRRSMPVQSQDDLIFELSSSRRDDDKVTDARRAPWDVSLQAEGPNAVGKEAR